MARSPRPATVRITVRLTPRASVDRIDGVVDGALRVRVAASPVEGAANEALIRLLAAEFGVGRRAVTIVSGGSARRKVVALEGFAREAVLARWPGLAL